MSYRAQIEPQSSIGQEVTRLALESDNMVEIGTWLGEGSTVCLRMGLERPKQRIYCVEVCPNSAGAAMVLHRDEPRIRVIRGTLVRPEELGPFDHPQDTEEARGWYVGETGLVSIAPYVMDELPIRIDLLVLDGGEWCSHPEFLKLRDRCGAIVLDDTNRAFSYKNWRAREWLLNSPEWKVIHDAITDRNGWLSAQRK